MLIFLIVILLLAALLEYFSLRGGANPSAAAARTLSCAALRTAGE